MIILERPYTSPEMVQYLVESQTPVLDNAEARRTPEHNRFNLHDDASFARLLNSGKRLYTTSETALSWVHANATDAALIHGITVMKDKFRLREALRPLYPDYRFREVRADELPDIDAESLPLPLVLKPTVGFFSVGVYVVNTVDDWRKAVLDIQARRAKWKAEYPSAVVGDDRFILEEYITGDEYAVDVYFDDAGEPVIVDILRHEFGSFEDVGDRLYYTSPEIIRQRLDEFGGYMKKAGEILGLRNFPAHVELRLSEKGIIPIEFNPLRFAGWCTTEISLFSYGFRTYDYYLRNARPDWDALLKGREGNIYSFVILDKSRKMPDNAVFDYAAARASFTEVLHERRVDAPDSPVFGFFFTRTPANNRAELDRIMRSDLTEYLR